MKRHMYTPSIISHVCLAALAANFVVVANAVEEPVFAAPISMIAPASEEIQRRSEASAVTLKNGNVLVLWCDLVGHSDNARGHISGQELDPAGRPIGEPRVIFPTPKGGLNTLSPAVRRLKDGRIGVAFSYRMSTKAASRQFSVSEDEGKTWSEPVMVSDGSDPYMTGCHDRLTVLESGRLIAPLHCSDDWDKHHLHVKVARSDDSGQTWRTTPAKLELPVVRWPGDRPHIESGCIEPGIVQRADGSLLMTIRTAMGTQFSSVSIDDGETWSSLKSLEVISPQAPANIARIPGTTDLLLIWTPTYDPSLFLGGSRNVLVACVSKDGGKSWPQDKRKILVSDPSRSIDYPSILFRDGEAWITLRVSSGPGVLQGKTGTALMRVPLTWFY